LARMLAEEKFGLASRACAIIEKAAVPVAHTIHADWAGGIAEASGREFIGLVDQRCILGRLGARPAPLNCKLVGVGTGGSAFWKGEGKPTPVTQLAFNGGAFPPLAVSAIVAIADELTKVGDPRAELWVRDELLRAMVAEIDVTFIDPANAGTADAKPASILHGLTPIDGSGVSDAEFLLKAVIDDFQGDLESAYWVARPETFVSLNSLTRPFVGARGGEMLGIPCIASRHVPQPAGGEILALVDGGGIAHGDTAIEIRFATEGTLEMRDSSLTQDGTTGTGSAQTSLWQAGLVGLMIDRHTNWSAVRPSVSFISNLELEAISA